MTIVPRPVQGGIFDVRVVDLGLARELDAGVNLNRVRDAMLMRGRA